MLPIYYKWPPGKQDTRRRPQEQGQVGASADDFANKDERNRRRDMALQSHFKTRIAGWGRNKEEASRPICAKIQPSAAGLSTRQRLPGSLQSILCQEQRNPSLSTIGDQGILNAH